MAKLKVGVNVGMETDVVVGVKVKVDMVAVGGISFVGVTVVVGQASSIVFVGNAVFVDVLLIDPKALTSGTVRYEEQEESTSMVRKPDTSRNKCEMDLEISFICVNHSSSIVTGVAVGSSGFGVGKGVSVGRMKGREKSWSGYI